MPLETSSEHWFRNKLYDLESRGKNVGLNLTTICRIAGISRATPDRWKRQSPMTIQILTRIEEIVEEREKEVAGTIPGED